MLLFAKIQYYLEIYLLYEYLKQKPVIPKLFYTAFEIISEKHRVLSYCRYTC